MKSMNYGTMPTPEEFADAFVRTCPNGYRIQLGRSDSKALEGFSIGGDGVWECAELYAACVEVMETTNAAEEWDGVSEECQNFVSCVLSTLGFEWI